MGQGPYLQMGKRGYLKPQNQQKRLIKQTYATMVQPFLLVLIFASPMQPHLKEFLFQSLLSKQNIVACLTITHEITRSAVELL